MTERDVDPGEPIAELAGLEESPADGFVNRIRSGILRRIAGVQVLEFVFDMLAGFLREMGDLFFQGPASSASRSRQE